MDNGWIYMYLPLDYLMDTIEDRRSLPLSTAVMTRSKITLKNAFPCRGGASQAGSGPQMPR